MIGTPPPTSGVAPMRSSPSMHGAYQNLLAAGTILAGRYEILQTLGEGGMGAVYKANDRALNRMVALKVIRPDLANNPAIIERFKQELLLAHQVTHKNVIRIYDLGESEGLKFITMEFIEGQDLRSLINQRQKLPGAEATEIMEQVCRALEAAHSAGIIHRDLKPQNIMRDKTGRILVMDFGLARTLEGDGMTQTGALVGTMDYMSPEQALGRDLDQRSDLFALGLIFYELLTGKMPYKADSVVASLLKRTQERAVPVASHDATIPPALSNIVSKCLETDVKLRYQSAQEILDDLEIWEGGGAKRKMSATSSGLLLNRMRNLPWKKSAGVVLALGLMIAATWYVSRRGKVATTATAAQHAPVSVLVADFDNKTGDSLFDDTLEPMFNVALEGASFINAFNRGNARQLAEKAPNPTNKLDDKTARLVAVSQGVNTVITGSLSNQGSGYRLAVNAVDAVTGKTLASTEVNAANKDEVLLQVPKLTVPIRKALGDSTPESAQLAATQGAFAASNLEAVHQYSIGMEQQFAGKWDEALKSFSKAAELDPNFARAYAGMAAAAGNLGQMQDAEKYAKLAMAHVDRMTERERYRVRGLYYIRSENWQKCVDEYSELVKQYPADNIGANSLASCYARMLNMPKAMQEGQRALLIAPKDVMARMNYSLYSCYASDFQSCEREAGAVLQQNPGNEEAYLALAYAQVGQEQLPQAIETYQKLQKISPYGESLAAAGLAEAALYQGRLRDGIQILEKSAAADLAAKKPDAAADKFVMLANAQIMAGNKAAAVAAAKKALANSDSTKIRFLAARVLIDAGDTAKAHELAGILGSAVQTPPQAYAKLILGELALKEHNTNQAIQLFNDSKGLLDTWISHFDLGRAYLEAGAFAEADSEFDRCLKRRGEVLELFMDDMPTYSRLPIVYYYQGRVREGLNSPGAADSYREYLNIRGKSTEDPLLADARARLAKQGK